MVSKFQAMGRPAKEVRLEWLRENVRGLGYNRDFTKGDTKGGAWPVHKIAGRMAAELGCVAPSTESIRQDLRRLHVEYVSASYAARAENEVKNAELLKAENFPIWRSKCFSSPVKNLVYETPDHQLAWFYLIAAAATVSYEDPVIIPEWVLEFLDMPNNLNELFADPQHMVSVFLLAPPRHGKTELSLHAMIWLMVKYPQVRMMYCNGKKDTTSAQLDYVRDQLEFNEYLVDNWGPFKDETCVWNKTEIQIAGRHRGSKARTLFGFGAKTNVASRDADVIWLDDPQGPAEAEHETNTDALYSWFRIGLITRREPHTALIGLGSHQPALTGDFWRRIEDDIGALSIGAHTVLMSKLPAHDIGKCSPANEMGEVVHEECLLWPTVRPYLYLEAIRGGMADDEKFEAVYNQKDLNPDNAIFPPNLFTRGFYRPDYDPDLEQTPAYTGTPTLDGDEQWKPGVLDYTRSWRADPPDCCNAEHFWAVGVDPAAGAVSGQGAFNGLIVRSLCPQCSRTYYIDYGEQRMSPEKIPDWIGSYVKDYPKVSRVRIEANVFAKGIARDPRLREMSHQYQFEVEEWITDQKRNDAQLGVPLVARSMRTGHSSIPFKEPEDQKYADRLIRGFKRWPGTPNDLCMADWMCHLSLTELYQTYQHRVYSQPPRRYNSERMSPATYRNIVRVPPREEIMHDDEPKQYFQM